MKESYSVVTGGGGFIGHHLVNRISTSKRVIVLDNFVRGVMDRLDSNNRNITVRHCDITDESQVLRALKDYKVDTVYHLAAINGTENFYKRPIAVMDVGVIGCINMLRYSKAHSVRKLVVASSAEVYQEASIIPTPEDVPLVVPEAANPRFSYGLSKIFTEYYSYQYGKSESMNIAIFRPHNVYGPDMGLKHVIPQFIMQFLTGSPRSSGALPIKLSGNANATRAFCYVDDIVDGIVLLGKRNQGVNVYNLGSSMEVSIKSLLALMADILGQKYEITEVENQHIGGASRRCPDVAKAEKVGFECSVDLREGIRRTIEWYLSNQKQVEAKSGGAY